MKFFIGTTFYSALLITKAPGTISSLVAFFLVYFIPLPPPVYVFAIVLMLGILHVYCFDFFVDRYKQPDPRFYTLDETIAVLVIWPFLSTPVTWILAFALFRVFDIAKPLGIRAFEQINSLPLALRNVGDDLIAALYTIVIVSVYRYVAQV